MKVFNEKNPYFINQTNYCIDPILKENCANLENIKLNSKHNQKNNKRNANVENNNSIKFQNKMIDESTTMKTHYLLNHNLNFHAKFKNLQLFDRMNKRLCVKFKNAHSLYKIKPYYNDYNNSKSCKSYSNPKGNKMNENNNTKDDNIINISIDNGDWAQSPIPNKIILILKI